MRGPFTLEQFKDPERAIAELGRQAAFSIYKNEIEPLYRENTQHPFLPGYPKDWEWRTYYVKAMSKNICRNCRSAAKVSHHIQHVGNGGLHHLINLLALCHDCHTAEHPEHA